MARRRADMELSVAMAGLRAALADAGRYAAHGVRTGGRRVGRRVRVVGHEAAHRGVLAARALGGRQPQVRKSRVGLMVVVAACATTAGAVAVLVARRAAVLLRDRDTGDGGSVDSVPAADAARQDRAASTPAG